MLKASRHSEMDEEVAATLELENQILAAAPDVRDALALERGGDSFRRLGPGKPVVEDPHAYEASPCERRREA